MRWISKDAAALAFLVLAGFAYYSQYYDCSFNTGDDGSLMLITMRLLEGERPYRDLQLGYGLLWYYPLILLFKITGVSFIVARIYLLSLAVAASLIAYLAVRRHTRIRMLAINVGLLVLALPGMLDHVYMALAVVASMLAVGAIDLDRRTLDGRRIFAAAAVAAVAWHIRPELGLGAALVLVATLIAHAISHPPVRWPRHLARLFALTAGGTLLPTLPLVLIAASQGFLERFLSYNLWPFRYLAQLPALARSAAMAEDGAEAEAEAQAAADGAEQAGTLLARIPLATIWEGGPLRLFATLTYLPLVALAIVALIVCFRMHRRRLRNLPAVANGTAGVLALAGIAFSAFPQFFLFRPDPGHLSFFMPGYIVLAAVCFGRWVLRAPADAGGSAGEAGSRLHRLGRVALGGLIVIHLGLYFLLGLNQPTAGSMVAMCRGRTERFLGKNGLDIAVTPFERFMFQKVAHTVEEFSDEGDALLCFPFGPGWNVITGRRAFTRALYFDDSLSPSWQPIMIAQIEKQRPPVIIVDDWPINRTEISRFKNWARLVMEHIHTEYVLVESQGSLELYVLRSAAAED